MKFVARVLWAFRHGWSRDFTPQHPYRNQVSGQVEYASFCLPECERSHPWRGLYGFWPTRGLTLNEGRGPINVALFWWPHLFWYCAIRWRGTWYRLSFDWSKP